VPYTGARVAAAGAPEVARATAATTRLRGRLVDANGRALAGVDVRVDALRRRTVDATGRETVTSSGTPSSAVRTDGRGRYQLDVPSGLHELVFETAALPIGHGLDPTTLERIDVLAGPVELRGRVVDERGAAAADVAVEAHVAMEALPDLPFVLRDVLDDRRASVRARSDATGAFSLPALPCGGLVLVEATGPRGAHAGARVSDCRGDALELVLRDPHAAEPIVRGHVIDANGSPAAGASVHLHGNACESGPDGRFELSIERGTPLATMEHVDLIAARPGTQPGRIEDFGARVRAGDAPDRVLLQLGPPARSIDGVVRDAEQLPVAGCEVQIADPVGFEGNSRTLEALAGWTPVRTDAAGRFRMVGLLDRSYVVRVLRPDGANVEVAGVAAGTHDLAIAFPADALREVFRGRIVDRNGAPLASATVKLVVASRSAVSDGFRHVAETRTDAQGAFELRAVPRTNAALALWGMDLADALLPIDATLPDAGHVFVVGRRVRMRVDPPSDQPGWAYRVLDERGRTLRVERVRPNGRSIFEDAPLRPGEPAVDAVFQDAATLVLLRDGVEVRRVPLALRPDELNVIAP
jgi:hypothetical protein